MQAMTNERLAIIAADAPYPCGLGSEVVSGVRRGSRQRCELFGLDLVLLGTGSSSAVTGAVGIGWRLVEVVTWISGKGGELLVLLTVSQDLEAIGNQRQPPAHDPSPLTREDRVVVARTSWHIA
jgi:hypothetical protein